MVSKRKLSTRLDFRGLSKQQEAFARLVVDGIPVAEAVAQIYSEDDANDFTALGDTVNVAARLQSEAGAGEIVLSEELFSVTSDLFQETEHRTITVRGRQQPVDVRVAPIATP